MSQNLSRQDLLKVLEDDVQVFTQMKMKASYQGTFTTAEGEQFMWWAHEKSRVVEGGKTKGLIMASGFTNSQKLSWMNNLIIAMDSEVDPPAQQFRATAYEWV